MQGFTLNKNLLNKTGCFTSWMKSANPSPRTWFLVVESEVCRKKGEILQEQEIAPSHPSGIRDREEGRSNCRRYVRKISEKFQLVAMCGTHKLNMWLYYTCWFTYSARELRSETWQENNAYPNIFLMALQCNILAQLKINFNRSHKSHCYIWNSASNLFTRGPVLFLLLFKKPMQLAVILIRETDVWSKFSSAFLLFDKSPFFQLSCFM